MDPTPRTVQASLPSLVEQATRAFEAGQWDRAESLAAQALSLDPRTYEAAQLRALAPLNAGRAADALPHAQDLVARFGHDAFAHNTHGAILQTLGRVEEAIEAYSRSISIAPGQAVSWFNMAELHTRRGAREEARECFAKVVELGGASPDASLRFAWLNVQVDALEIALQPARDAARELADSAEAVSIAAHCELNVGDLGAALDGYQRLQALAPPPDRWRFIRAIAMPAIIESREQAAGRFAQVDAALDDLIAHPARIADPLQEVGLTSFYMAYLGIDDTPVQRKLAQAYRLAAPALEGRSTHVNQPPRTGARIRVGIVSRHLANHTIGKLNIGIAQKLDRRRFEVIVMRPPSTPDFLSDAFDECADGTVKLALDLAAARQKIAEARPDVLFYPDIGMDAFTYFLAFARLARVQFTTWGHPVTTGIPNLDYFLSTRHAEPADAQRFYTERLVALENPPSYYYRPRPPSSFDLRAQLGVGASVRLYASTQTLYKMHPDFDDALAQILRRDSHARVVLIAAKREAWNEKLRARIRRSAPDVADRIVFVPQLSLPDYLAVLAGADALLDTFHFGGGSSTYESFGMSAPVVTLPGAHMRGRISAALYRRMGQSRWIARDADDFVRLALELAHGAEKTAWRREIAEGANAFMENDAVVREYEEFIETAVANAGVS